MVDRHARPTVTPIGDPSAITSSQGYRTPKKKDWVFVLFGRLLCRAALALVVDQLLALVETGRFAIPVPVRVALGRHRRAGAAGGNAGSVDGALRNRRAGDSSGAKTLPINVLLAALRRSGLRGPDFAARASLCSNGSSVALASCDLDFSFDYSDAWANQFPATDIKPAPRNCSLIGKQRWRSRRSLSRELGFETLALVRPKNAPSSLGRPFPRRPRIARRDDVRIAGTMNFFLTSEWAGLQRQYGLFLPRAAACSRLHVRRGRPPRGRLIAG